MNQIKIILEALRKLTSEFIGIIAALFIFYISPFIYRLIDPTAGSYDLGVLQVIIFSMVGTLVFSFLAWIGISINFPFIFDYMQIDFKQDFKNLDPWQKIKTSLFVLFGYLALLAILARVL